MFTEIIIIIINSSSSRVAVVAVVVVVVVVVTVVVVAPLLVVIAIVVVVAVVVVVVVVAAASQCTHISLFAQIIRFVYTIWALFVGFCNVVLFLLHLVPFNPLKPSGNYMYYRL